MRSIKHFNSLLTKSRNPITNKLFISTITTTSTAKTTPNMPLVDPVTTSAGGDKTQEWQNKLVGKKIGDSSDATVC